MLTFPSDPIPQIVCPMDEDVIPPNRYCSAPSHSEPTPPLLPLSSITPSCANDEISGHRRSGRIQGIRAQTPKKQSNTDSGAAHKPSRQISTPSKRQKEGGKMVQVSQSKQPRVESTQTREKQNEDGFDYNFEAELQNKQNDQKIPQKKTSVPAAENIADECFEDAAQNLDITKSDMDTCGGAAVGHLAENASAPKGWVIGPLFQSFKSKMASFTEIVMSPVKLFKANSPPPSTDTPDALNDRELQADETADAEPSEPNDMFNPEVQSENGNGEIKPNQQRLSKEESEQNTKTFADKCSKVLSFDVELSGDGSEQQADECAITENENNIADPVPLQHSPLPRFVSEEVSVEPVFGSSVLSEPSVKVSASHKSKLKISSVNEEQKGKLAARLKPQPRKCTGNRKKVTSKTLTPEFKEEESDPDVLHEQMTRMNSVKSNKTDSRYTDRTQLSSSVWFGHPGINHPQPDEEEEEDDNDDGRRIECCRLVRQSLRSNVSDSADGRTLKSTLDARQLNPESHSAPGLGRSKRELNVDCHSRDFVKRKRLTADVCVKDIKKQELANVASDGGAPRGLRPPKKEVVLTNTVVNGEEMMEPARKRQTVSTRANKKGKGGQEVLAKINEVVLNAQTESSSGVMLVCSPDEGCGLAEKNHKGSISSKMKPTGSCKRLKTKPGFDQPDVNIETSMDLETTIAITSAKEAEQDQLSEVLVRPDIKQLHSTKKSKNINNKKPLKRKSPNQANSMTESESTVVSSSAAPSVEPLESTPSDMNTSQHIQNEKSSKTGLNQPSKRPKKGLRGSVKQAASSESRETKQCIDNLQLITKENKCQESKGKIPMDPVYFEMTPSESNHQPGPSSSQLHGDCYVQLYNDVETFMDEKEKDTDAELSNHGSISVSRRRPSATRVMKPRRADKQRRQCRVLHGRKHKNEELTNSVTMDDADLVTAAKRSSENGLSRPLLRSYSCPEIHSLRTIDLPWTSSLHAPHHSRIHTSHQHQSSHTPLAHHVHKSLRRARRHTVCSIEVEREIAPLCLRKEVYPSRRSLPYDGVTQNLSPTHALSPSTSLSALATCFLSSPLAFLSKKIDSRGAANPSTSSHVPSPTSSSLHPLSPSTWRLPGFFQRADSCGAALDCSGSGIPLECEIERRPQSEEEYYEDTSSSSQEFEDAAMREEKSLSDSEIKVVQKHERGKVSSIRIRKTLPKPLNNLTPMGLPKPIRLKKKEFSLEEIYTNKNFSKPPESRLETIFEVPLNRRNGSESWFGQRRLKRFLEFLEVGEARKPKKPLSGVTKASFSSSRTRRGASPRDEASLSVQDVDSLLCAKLDQLNLWLMHDQKDS